MKHWTQRSGVWVETEQGVGIRILERMLVSKDGSRKPVSAAVQANAEAGERIEHEPWIHLTNADGTTLAQIPEAVCKGVRQARQDAIPACRVEHLDEDRLAQLGYEKEATQ